MASNVLSLQRYTYLITCTCRSVCLSRPVRTSSRGSCQNPDTGGGGEAGVSMCLCVCVCVTVTRHYLLAHAWRWVSRNNLRDHYFFVMCSLHLVKYWSANILNNNNKTQTSLAKSFLLFALTYFCTPINTSVPFSLQQGFHFLEFWEFSNGRGSVLNNGDWLNTLSAHWFADHLESSGHLQTY